MFARIEDGAIVEWAGAIPPVPQPKDGEQPAPPADWRPLVQEWPEFDRTTHQAGNPVDAIEPDRIRRTWPVVPRQPTADDVRAEAQRRIIAATGAASFEACIVKQMNALMRATELANKRAAGGTLTDAETAEAAALQGLADQIKALRAKSNAMEGNPPADYRSDSRWA